jgi:hypothetical protein
MADGVYQLDSGQKRDFELADGAETAVRGWVGRIRTEAFRGRRKHSNCEELDGTSTVAATNGDNIWSSLFMSPVREREGNKVRHRLGAGSSIVASEIIASEIIASAIIAHHRHLLSLYIHIYSLYNLNLSRSLAAHRYLSSSVRLTPSLFDLRPSTLARRSPLRQSSLHPSLPHHPSLETRD